MSQILIFAKQFLRPRQTGAHDMSHVWHTLDTPLKTRDAGERGHCLPIRKGGNGDGGAFS